MEDYVFMRKNNTAEQSALALGYTKVNFLDTDFILLRSKTKKDVLKEIQLARQKKLKTLYKPDSEEMLRFMLEKSDADIIFGLETLHPKDSTHFVRAGLDQVLCTLAAKNGKTIAFSFHEVLQHPAREQLLARMRFNLKLCREYHVKTILSTFAQSLTGMRSAKDLDSFFKTLEKEKLW